MSYKSHIIINNKKYLFFGGTAYLGLNFNPEIKQLINHGFDHFGTNYGASRLNDTCFDLYEHAENTIAKWLNTESAVLCSSGTVAGIILLHQLQEKYHFIHYKNLHPSLANNIKNKSTIVSSNHEITNAIQHCHSDLSLLPCLLVNSLNPIQLFKTDFDFLQHVTHDLLLVIDDSHGFGILGDNGEGISSTIIGLPSNIQVVIVGSLGKGLSIPSGIIAARQEICASIKDDAMWAGSAPTAPGFIYCFNNMESIIEQQREKLFYNINYFKNKKACSVFFDFIDDFPVFKFKRNHFSKLLKENGIIISGFSYPRKTDPFVERVIVSSLHSTKDIDLLFKILNHE